MPALIRKEPGWTAAVVSLLQHPFAQQAWRKPQLKSRRKLSSEMPLHALRRWLERF